MEWGLRIDWGSENGMGVREWTGSLRMEWGSECLTIDLVLRGGLDVKVEWAVPGGGRGRGRVISTGSH